MYSYVVMNERTKVKCELRTKYLYKRGESIYPLELSSGSDCDRYCVLSLNFRG